MIRSVTAALSTLTLGAFVLHAQEKPATLQPGPALMSALDFLQGPEKPARSVQLSGDILEAKGALKDLKGAHFELQLQPPR